MNRSAASIAWTVFANLIADETWRRPIRSKASRCREPSSFGMIGRFRGENMNRFLLCLVALLVGGSSAGRAQSCTASLPDPGAPWIKHPVSEYGDARVKQVAHVVCRSCKPEVAMIVSAGPMQKPKSPSMFDGKTGAEFAKTIYDDPTLRTVFLDDLMRAEQQKAPGCSVLGDINGVTEIGGLGMLAFGLRAQCPNQAQPISAEYYGGFDGSCEFVAKVFWLGGQPLDGDSKAQVQRILRSVRWKQ
jgi:hypothetical protein